MRTFTAIPVPDDIKTKLTAITRGRLPVPYINTVNLHITLNFLGELTDDEVEKAKTLFPSLVGRTRRKFKIEFEKFVNFRNQIHLLPKDNEDLRRLQSDLEKGFRENGFSFADRNYYPHIKLANMHIDNTMHRERKLINFPIEELQALDFTASKAALFESKLLLHHAHHKSLLEIELI